VDMERLGSLFGGERVEEDGGNDGVGRHAPDPAGDVTALGADVAAGEDQDHGVDRVEVQPPYGFLAYGAGGHDAGGDIFAGQLNAHEPRGCLVDFRAPADKEYGLSVGPFPGQDRVQHGLEGGDQLAPLGQGFGPIRKLDRAQTQGPE